MLRFTLTRGVVCAALSMGLKLYCQTCPYIYHISSTIRSDVPIKRKAGPRPYQASNLHRQPSHAHQGLKLAHFKAQLEDLRDHIAHVGAQLQHLRDSSTGQFGSYGGQRELKSSGNGQSKLKLSGNGNEGKPLV